MRLATILILLGLSLTSPDAQSWSHRGHELITEVASRLVVKDPRVNGHLKKFFTAKSGTLAHVSNAPDVYWRNLSKEVEAQNGPTHFFDIEFGIIKGSPLVISNMPASINQLASNIHYNCKRDQVVCPSGDDILDKIKTAGTLPFRIAQLAQRIEKRFSDMAENQTSKKYDREIHMKLLNSLLVELGLLSHFVGNLSNPLHTSMNYDGQLTNQAGLHRYFEEKIVDNQDLHLMGHVFDFAIETEPIKQITKDHKVASYLDLAWAGIITSHRELGTLLEIDRKHSLLQESAPMKRSKRKRPYKIHQHYHKFIVQQMALSADLLKEFWIRTWLSGNKPSFKRSSTYFYPQAPEFIPPDYMDLKTKP